MYSGVRGLRFELSIPLLSVFVYASSEGSGETVSMHRLVRATAVHLYLYLYLNCITPLRGLCAGARKCSVSRRILGIKIKVP